MKGQAMCRLLRGWAVALGGVAHDRWIPLGAPAGADAGAGARQHARSQGQRELPDFRR